MLKDYWYIWTSLAALGIGLNFVFRKGFNENAPVRDRLISISITALTVIPLYLSVININSLGRQTNASSPSSIISDLKSFADNAQKTINETKALKESLVKPGVDQAAINPKDTVSLSSTGVNPILISANKEIVINANKYISESDTYNLLRLISDKKIFSVKSGTLATVTKIDNENKLLAIKITSLSKDDKGMEKLFINKEFWVNYDSVVLQIPVPSKDQESQPPKAAL